MIEILSTITLEYREEFKFSNPWIILNGKNTGKKIEGAELECAIKWGDFYVIFTLDNTWEPSGLNVLFYNSEFSLLDSAYLGIYPLALFPFIRDGAKFEIVKVIQPDCIIVNYDLLWKIKLLPKKRFIFPFISEPSSVLRGDSSFGHFLVSYETKSINQI